MSPGGCCNERSCTRPAATASTTCGSGAGRSPRTRPPQRGLPRLRRAPGDLRRRASHGSDRPRAGHRPGGPATAATSCRTVTCCPVDRSWRDAARRGPGAGSHRRAGRPRGPQPSPARPAEKIGRGLALFFHGGGFTGSGETRISARGAGSGVTSRGRVRDPDQQRGDGPGGRRRSCPMVAAEAPRPAPGPRALRAHRHLGGARQRTDRRLADPRSSSVRSSSRPAATGSRTCSCGFAARRGVDRASLSCRDGHVFTGAEDLGPLLEVAVGFADIDEALEGVGPSTGPGPAWAGTMRPSGATPIPPTPGER